MNKNLLTSGKTSALIGYTGFVGGVLGSQNDFTENYNSKNIGEIQGKSFDIVVCAGAPGQKWLANKEPKEDLKIIESLIESIFSIKSFSKIVLISTIDVYGEPIWVDENSPTYSNQPYGENRSFLEQSLLNMYGDKVLIVRLPGLFGDGLKKNAIFDLLNDNNIEDIPVNGILQYYDMSMLSFHIKEAIDSDTTFLNLATEPISNLEIVEKFFPEKLGIAGKNNSKNFKYDMRTVKSSTGYIMEREEVFKRLGDFISNYKKGN